MPFTPPADTFTWPAKRASGPLSPNIENPQCWQDEGILVPHEMFRWYFAEIREMLKAMDGTQAWKAKLFAPWLEVYVLDAIHHHHNAEETLYNPMITNKGGKIEDSIETDHTSLMDGIEKTRALTSRMKMNDKQALAEFKVFFEKWMQECERHFDTEEIQYPSQLKATNITQEEEAAVVSQIIQSLGLEGNKTMLPAMCWAMCLWNGEEKMQAWFDSGPPPPIRLMANKCWASDFYVNNLRVIEAIKDTMDVNEYVPASPQCGCTVS